MMDKLTTFENKLIKVLNPEIAEKLITLGFSYIKEPIGETTVYGFLFTHDLEKILTSQFSSKDYFVENKIRF